MSINLLTSVANVSTAQNLSSFASGFLSGLSPLQIAIQDRHPEVARFLIQNGAKVSEQEKKGLSSLIPLAIREGQLDTVLCLLQNGASIEEKDLMLLNRELLLAVQDGHYDKIDVLVEIGADINLKNEQGVTPLQMAVLQDRGIEMIRFLIDRGALVIRNCYEEQIRKYLLQKGLSENNVIRFVYQKCPKLHALEVFQDGAFHSFSKVKRVAFTQPIALFNVAAYEDFGPNYGAIGDEFLVPPEGISSSYLSFYKTIAEKFTVMRVRVEDPHQFVPIIHKVREVFSGLQLLHWSLHAHSCPTDMQLGKTTTFNLRAHGPIMRDVGEEMAPLGATIGLLGCKVAFSEANSSNLCQGISSWARKQIVCGAPHQTTGVLPTSIDVPSLNIHALLPVYKNEKGQPALMKAYKAGELILDGYLPRSRI